MPSIDVAMARSVQPSPWLSIRDALARSIANDLQRRNIVEDTQGKVTDIQTALSSWNNCMAASFCKYVDLRFGLSSLLTSCSQVARHCYYGRRRSHSSQYCGLYRTLLLLWYVVLLQLLQLPQVLWQLLWLLRCPW
jgi:hypothetical protein